MKAHQPLVAPFPPEVQSSRYCGQQGSVTVSGGLERSDEKGIDLLTRACDHGHTSSCFVLGLRYRKGISVPKNESKAMQYLKVACDGGDKTACEQLSK